MRPALRCNRLLPVAALAVAMTTSAHAQGASQRIFKCVDGETNSYQSMPCGGGQTEVRVMTVARAPEAQPQQPSSALQLEAANAAAVPVPTAQSRGKVWPPRRLLMLGMSDDEVLNLPGWGVPKQITRSKAPREYKEEWTYLTSTGERKLTFVNATLVDAVVDNQASRQIAIQQIERRTYPAT